MFYLYLFYNPQSYIIITSSSTLSFTLFTTFPHTINHMCIFCSYIQTHVDYSLCSDTILGHLIALLLCHYFLQIFSLRCNCKHTPSTHSRLVIHPSNKPQQLLSKLLRTLVKTLIIIMKLQSK
jgi:hypothetical protein